MARFKFTEAERQDVQTIVWQWHRAIEGTQKSRLTRAEKRKRYKAQREKFIALIEQSIDVDIED